MMRSTIFAIVAAATAIVTAGPQQTPQAPPVFRGRAEIVALDIVVLDRNRLPVRGLTANDFTITEDGQPQRIVNFDAVDLPDPEVLPAKWMVNVTPDVATNSINDSRLFVMVMDDATMGNDPRAVNDAKKIALSVVDKLGPADLMTVVFPRDNRHTQDFTSDHTKLTAAINHYTMGFAGMAPRGDLALPVDTEQYYKQSSVDTVGAAAEILGTVPDRRKILIYVSAGVPLDIPEPTLISPDSPISINDPTVVSSATAARNSNAEKADLGWRTSELIRLAREANVSVYTIDPCGLRAPSPPPAPCQPGLELSFLQAVANATGGHAVIHTNDFEPGITGIFRENASYYLIGYRSTSAKPSGLRRLNVRVNRPGVEVKYKHEYRPEPASRMKLVSAAPGTPKPNELPAAAIESLNKALSGILPSPDMPLQVALAPFANPDRKSAKVAIVLGLRQPSPEMGTAPRVTETVDLQTRAFTPEGKSLGWSRQIAKVTLVPSGELEFRFEVLSQIDLKPGRYQLRLAAHRESLAKTGSVYGEVEVPDFAGASLSLSGIVLSAVPGLVAGGQESLKNLLPLVPTSERTFYPGARVTVFCRAYQGGRSKLVDVPLTLRIMDGQDRALLDQKLTLAATHFSGSTRAGDIRFQLPIDRLKPGPHVLTLEATLGKTTARRDVRFTIK